MCEKVRGGKYFFITFKDSVKSNLSKNIVNKNGFENETGDIHYTIYMKRLKQMKQKVRKK